MSGYFLIARGLFEHPVFDRGEPFTAREAWVWLIERANFAESRFRYKSQVFSIARGCIATSYRSLAETWRWSPNRVIRELKVWQAEGMVVVNTEHGYVHLTLCNYERYQNRRNADGTVTEQQRNTDGTATDTNQKKVKKESNERKDTPPTPSLPEWLDVSTWDSFREMRRGLKGGAMTKRAEELLLVELGRLREQGHDPTAVLEQSIRNNWKDVYRIKGDRNENTGRNDARNHNGKSSEQGGGGTGAFSAAQSQHQLRAGDSTLGQASSRKSRWDIEGERLIAKYQQQAAQRAGQGGVGGGADEGMRPAEAIRQD